MGKKKTAEIVDTSTTLELGLDELMSDRFGRYSKYIIQERALPDARDGLKPVQRRILYAMWEDGNTFEKPHRKSAKAVGYIIGYYHPHGDSSVYDAIVRLSQSWKMNVPLIDMQGNNGSIDDDPAAAMRYTEARLAKISETMLEDIDKECVSFTNNYDDSLLEPTVLPTRFPLLLVNGSTGIASGYATNIAPHNLTEVIDATIYRLNNPNCSVKDLMEYIKGPDFPTGGIVQGLENIQEVFETGRGKVVLRARTEIKEERSFKQIVITEIPYEVVKVNLVKKIDEIRINKELDGILDVRDESGREGLRITIDLKKDVDENLILNYLYKNTDLQINYNYNMIAIVDHRPMLMSLTMCLDAFINHRKDVILKRSKFLLSKKQERIHVIEGLIKAISVLDEIIDIIRHAKDKADSKAKISEAFGFTDIQAEAIVTLRLYRLSNTDVRVLKEEYADLIREINELNAIISSETILNSVIVKDLKEIKELYGYPRRTSIEKEIEEIVIDKRAMIPNEQCVVVVSHDGYVKRVSMRGYTANEGQIPGIKDSDYLIGYQQVETLDTLLLFTNLGNYAYLPIYEIDDMRWKDLGKHFSIYASCEAEEKIVAAIVVKNFDTYASITLASKKGMIKRSMIKDFELQRYSKTATAMKLEKDDEVISAHVTYENDEVILGTREGYYNRYSLAIVNPTGTKSKGVKGIALKKDELADFVVIHDFSDNLLAVNKNFQMKRIKLDDIDLTNRGTKGLRLFKQVKSNPLVLSNLYLCRAYDSLLMINGSIDEIQCKDVPFMNLDATFSNQATVSSEGFLIPKRTLGIEVVEIVDFPKENESNNPDLEQLSIF